MAFVGILCVHVEIQTSVSFIKMKKINEAYVWEKLSTSQEQTGRYALEDKTIWT